MKGGPSSFCGGHVAEERIIGIVGGVGPYAGLDLQQKIAAQTIARKDQDHVTVLSVSRPSLIPDRTDYLLGFVPQNPAEPLAEQVQLLAKMGADVVAIPCNTAHAAPIFNELRRILEAKHCNVHLLHMIEEAGRFMQETAPQVQKVGILSTTGTYLSGVYPEVLERLGFTAVTPAKSLQEELIHPAIYDPVYGIKATGVVSEKSYTDLMTGISALIENGVDAIILGCSEIPLAITERQIGDVLIVEPNLILARALIREANPEKLRPWTECKG